MAVILIAFPAARFSQEPAADLVQHVAAIVAGTTKLSENNLVSGMGKLVSGMAKNSMRSISWIVVAHPHLVRPPANKSKDVAAAGLGQTRQSFGSKRSSNNYANTSWLAHKMGGSGFPGRLRRTLPRSAILAASRLRRQRHRPNEMAICSRVGTRSGRKVFAIRASFTERLKSASVYETRDF
jgi:hypothetical protein